MVYCDEGDHIWGCNKTSSLKTFSGSLVYPSIAYKLIKYKLFAASTEIKYFLQTEETDWWAEKPFSSNIQQTS